MPKALHRAETKSESFCTRISPTAKEGLKELAQSLGISMSELLEQLGRGMLTLQKTD